MIRFVSTLSCTSSTRSLSTVRAPGIWGSIWRRTPPNKSWRRECSLRIARCKQMMQRASDWPRSRVPKGGTCPLWQFSRRKYRMARKRKQKKVRGPLPFGRQMFLSSFFLPRWLRERAGKSFFFASWETWFLFFGLFLCATHFSTHVFFRQNVEFVEFWA